MCSNGENESCKAAKSQIMEWVKCSKLKGAINFDPLFIQMLVQSNARSADILTTALILNKKNVEELCLILHLINQCLETSDQFVGILNSRNVLGALNTICLINFESMALDKDKTSIEVTKQVCSLIQKLVNENIKTYTLIQLVKHIVKLTIQ